MFYFRPLDLDPTVTIQPGELLGGPAAGDRADAVARHGQGGRARWRSSKTRFRALERTAKTPRDGEAHREVVGVLCWGRGARKEARGVRQLALNLGEIRNRGRRRLGLGKMLGWENKARGVVRNFIGVRGEAYPALLGIWGDSVAHRLRLGYERRKKTSVLTGGPQVSARERMGPWCQPKTERGGCVRARPGKEMGRGERGKLGRVKKGA